MSCFWLVINVYPLTNTKRNQGCQPNHRQYPMPPHAPVRQDVSHISPVHHSSANESSEHPSNGDELSGSALIALFSMVISNNSCNSDQHLALVKPRFESSQTAFCSSCVEREIEPVVMRMNFWKLHRAVGRYWSYQVQIAAIIVMMKSMMNSHFQPKRPAIPPSRRRPLAMSPLTAVAILYEGKHVQIANICNELTSLPGRPRTMPTW